MLREEAEHQAARRNLEDPDRERFEFYAYDESAGLADDAWDVGARLRDAGAAIAAAPPPERPPPPPRRPPPPPPPDPVAAPDPQATVAWELPPVEEEDRVVGHMPEAPPLEEPAPRGGRFARTIGALTMVVGMLWMAMIVAVAFLLRPDNVAGLGLYLGAAALGLVAIAMGVAIRRS